MKLFKKFSDISEKINIFFMILACALTAFVMLFICAEIIVRFFLNSSIPGSLEITEYCLLYITFLGSAWLVKQDRHIKMDLLLNRLKPRAINRMNLITSITGAIICLALTWYSGETTWDQFQRGVYRPTTLEIPIAYVIAVIPIGSFFMFVEFLKNTFKYSSDWRELSVKEDVAKKSFDSKIGY